MSAAAKHVTLKQWQRRAQAAEGELEILRQMLTSDTQREMRMARELARLRVAITEITDVMQWATESEAP